MNTAEALALANQVKPRRRASLDKLQGGTITAADLSARVTALSKSYNAMDRTLAKAQRQISQIAADLEYVENFTPGSVDRAHPRRFHS